MVFEQHEFLVQPGDSDATLWRYWDIPKFLSLLSTRSLWFSRADLLGDSFEGSFSAATVRARAARSEAEARELGVEVALIREMHNRMGRNADWGRYFTFVNCWTRKDHESWNLWQNYAGGAGVATRTTFKSLTDAVTTGERIHATEVRYIDFDRIPMHDFNLLSPYIHKRIQFSEESELRLIILGRYPPQGGVVGELVAQSPPGIAVPVDLNVLVNEVRVHPGAPFWFRETVRAVAERFHLYCPVTASEVDGSPSY